MRCVCGRDERGKGSKLEAAMDENRAKYKEK